MGFLCRNKKGHLPIHAIPSDDIGNKLLYILHSVGAPRCSKTQKSCNLGCKYDESKFILMLPLYFFFKFRAII